MALTLIFSSEHMARYIIQRLFVCLKVILFPFYFSYDSLATDLGAALFAIPSSRLKWLSDFYWMRCVLDLEIYLEFCLFCALISQSCLHN